MQEERKQPKYDLEPVLDATIDDLNQDVLNAVVSRNKMIIPQDLRKNEFGRNINKVGGIGKK